MKPSIVFLSFFLGAQYARASHHMLSFIMPCYNSVKTVERSLASIFDQGITIPFEVVCVDDGSSDGTYEYLKAYQQEHLNLRVYRHEHNRGAGAAANTCVRYAQGDLLFRLDSDNILPQNTVNRLIDLLDETGCDGATVAEIRFFSGNLEHAGSWFYKSSDNICDLRHVVRFLENPAHSGNYLFTRASYERAGGYPEVHGHDTFVFGFWQFATGSRIAVLPDSFYWHMCDKNGYYEREKAKGGIGTSILRGLRMHREVFTEETCRYLDLLDGQGIDIEAAVSNNWLRLKPEHELKALFARYVTC